MRHPGGTTIAILGALAFACASPGSTQSEKVDPAFAKYVLSAVPADVANPTFVDFGGKVHLVGWEISPKDRFQLGKALSVKLYWRSVGKLGRGYHLFTHLTDPDGKVYEFDDVGPLREMVSDSEFGKVARLPPSAWIPGMVYVDEQSFTVPDAQASVLTLSVGLESETYASDAGEREKVGEFRLEVLSGVSDGKEGALLARLPTDLRRGDKGQKDKGPRDKGPRDREFRRRTGTKPGSDRPPGLPSGRGPFGQVHRLDKENAQ